MLMPRELDTYEKIISQNPAVSQIITPGMASAMFQNNDHTVAGLSETWSNNTRKNLKLLKKHGPLVDSFGGFGKNKAVIAVGAGPSFNKNKDVLKAIYNVNLQFPLESQPFLIIASNKMFKPLLKMGIHPHFVVLIDAGDALYPQLCEGIPEKAKNSILITGLHASNKILKQWDKDGGHICFYMIGEDREKKLIRKRTKYDPERLHIHQGGNVLNTLWILTQRFLGCKVYITVGNDLAFEYSEDKEERAKSFYADGDYRLNILNKRDEAKDKLGWMGFDLSESLIEPGKSLCDLRLFGTSKQLWIYKTWMEVQVGIWSAKEKFHFYNCSESGILGMIAKDMSRDQMYQKDNWFLLDNLFPKHWHTRTLKKACQDFLEAKALLCQTRKRAEGIVLNAEALPARMGTARIAGL
jgi:hypothetical protein